MAFDPPRNGNNLTDRIVVGNLQHSRNEDGAAESEPKEDGFCVNIIQQEDGAAESEPKEDALCVNIIQQEDGAADSEPHFVQPA